MKAKKRFYVNIIILSIVIIIVCLLTLPMFNANSIKIVGIDDKNEIISNEISEIVKNKSIFLANRHKIKEYIEQNPYLKYKMVKYSLPSTLVIEVDEIIAKYYVEHMNSYIYLSEDGTVLNSQRNQLDYNVPMVKGFNINSFAIGEILNVSDKMQILSLESIINRFYLVGLNNSIETIDISDYLNITMTTKDGYQIVFGTSDSIEKKIEWIYVIIEKMENDNVKECIINVSTPESPTYKIIN